MGEISDTGQVFAEINSAFELMTTVADPHAHPTA